MQKFIIWFYTKHCNIWAVWNTLYLLELYNKDKWLMSTSWHWRNIWVYIEQLLQSELLTDDLDLTYILWAELTIIYSAVNFKMYFSLCYYDSFK